MGDVAAAVGVMLIWKGSPVEEGMYHKAVGVLVVDGGLKSEYSGRPVGAEDVVTVQRILLSIGMVYGCAPG